MRCTVQWWTIVHEITPVVCIHQENNNFGVLYVHIIGMSYGVLT